MNHFSHLSGLGAALVLVPVLAAQQPVEVPEDLPPGDRKVEVKPNFKTGAPNDWFDKTRYDLGAHLNKDKITGSFNWKNPRGKTIQWRDFSGSCQCVRAVITVGDWTYELVKDPRPNSLFRLDKDKDGNVKQVAVDHINIGPNDEGKITVQMEMNGLQGTKGADLHFSTTDPLNRQMRLEWQATGIKFFDVNPPEVFFNDMGWDDVRKFSFKISSVVHPDFKLLKHEPLPSYVKLSKKEQVTVGGKKMWLVEGSIGPNADPNAGGARIVFDTSTGKKVDLGVVASVQRPVDITPGTFFSFGRIARKKGKDFEVKIVPNDKFDLKVEKVEFLNTTVDKKFFSCETSKEGTAVVLKVRVAAGAKGAYILKGSMAVSLNHPTLKKQVFDFNGILR